MPDIRTRDAVKGTIKAIDKSAVASQSMKDTLVKAKEKAEHSTRAKESSPEEYAANRITDSADTAVYSGVQLAKKAARKGKAAVSDAKNSLEERKAAQPREQARDAAKKTTETTREAARSGSLPIEEPYELPSGPSPPEPHTALMFQPEPSGTRIKTREHSPASIRTREREKKSIKLSPYSAKDAAVSPDGGARSIKTIEHRSQTAITVSSQNAQMTRSAAKTPAQTAQKTVQASQKAARETIQATKRAAETAAKAARAAIAETKAMISALTAGGGIAVFVILVVVLLGVAVALFGRRSSTSSYTPVSAEVEAYTQIITIYAQQHGIPEYVELIKAVMMQESGGQGGDPMQCSESGYNTRYPHYPNAITDPEYSIDVGVQTLADVLRMAGAESPIDLDRVSLALQGYNYGPGYISWALANYGGYSEMNAIEFSNIMAAQYGWSGYGDKAYVSHVLRYYPLGRIFFGEGNQAIVEVAQSQIGNEGGLIYCEWYGYPYRVAWCAIFVSWCADQCGFLDTGVLPRMEGVRPYVDWFRERGQWQDRSYEPMAGDIIFLDWESDGLADHVGIVERVEGGVIYTVEGNADDRCIENHYYLGSAPVYGFGLPAY